MHTMWKIINKIGKEEFERNTIANKTIKENAIQEIEEIYELNFLGK